LCDGGRGSTTDNRTAGLHQRREGGGKVETKIRPRGAYNMQRRQSPIGNITTPITGPSGILFNGPRGTLLKGKGKRFMGGKGQILEETERGGWIPAESSRKILDTVPLSKL